MKTLPATILSLLVFVGTYSTSSAQEKNLVRFSLVALGDNIPKLYYKTQSKEESLEITAFQQSVVQSFPAGKPLEFYAKPLSKTDGDKDVDKETTDQPVNNGGGPGSSSYSEPTPVLPAPVMTEDVSGKSVLIRTTLPQADEVLLLIAPKQEKDGLYPVKILSINSTSIPGNCALFYNLSTMPIAVRCNLKTAVALQPGEQQIVAVNDRRLILQSAYQMNGSYHETDSNVYPSGPNFRRVVFFMNGNTNVFAKSGNPPMALSHFTIVSWIKPDKPATSPPHAPGS